MPRLCTLIHPTLFQHLLDSLATNTLYMVGGQNGDNIPFEYSHLNMMFDPTKYPVNKIEPLHSSKFSPMVFPYVIRAEDKIYMITYFDNLCETLDAIGPFDKSKPFRFQYFDPTQKLFGALPPPPHSLPNDRDSLSLISIWFHVVLNGYIYLVIGEYFHTFKFNTTTSKWQDCRSLVEVFNEKCVPFPFTHSGDVGVSDELANNTRILVALNGAQPTAYLVRLIDSGDIDSSDFDRGDFEPISYRLLTECKTDIDIDEHYSRFDVKQLADMGGGRFCVMRSTLSIEFLIYVFRIHFEHEYNIQTFGSGDRSSEIIFSTKFNPNDTLLAPHNDFVYTGFCVASAPPPASPGNEDQDRDDRKMKRKKTLEQKLLKYNVVTTKRPRPQDQDHKEDCPEITV